MRNDPGILSAGGTITVRAVSSVSIRAESVSSCGVAQADSTIRLDLGLYVHVLTAEVNCAFFKRI